MILINGVELRPFAHQTADDPIEDEISDEYRDDVLNDIVATSEDSESHY